MRSARLICAGLRSLPDESVQCVVTSPPYWGLRDYGVGCWHAWGGDDHCGHCGAWRGSLGLEPTPALFLDHVVAVFREVRRVLRRDGTCWVNMGDCYVGAPPGNDRPDHSGGNLLGTRGLQGASRRAARVAHGRGSLLKPKNLVGMPWRLALALQEDGWWLRADIIWDKPNPMPESVTDRPTKAHEYIFLLTRSAKYFYDAEAVREPSTSGERQPGRGSAAFADRVPTTHKAPPLDGAHGTMGQDGKGMRMPEKWCHPAGRNLRTVWSIATSPFPGAHFATFPPEIPERCIRAGTSERGCCPACGAPWSRIVEVGYENPGNRASNGPRSSERRWIERGTAGYEQRLERRSTTTGWAPTCKCPTAEPVACAVLDPFAGAGTTLMVALRLNRRAIGIELSLDYCEMAARRIEGDAPLFNSVNIERLPTAEATAGGVA